MRFGLPGSNTNAALTINGCGVQPSSTSNQNISVGGSYSVNATLLIDAKFIATVTDANGCSYTIPDNQGVTVNAEDVRCFAGNSGNAKVKLCHKTGSAKNPCVSICVDPDAVAEHLAHGDAYGTCPTNGTCLAPHLL